MEDKEEEEKKNTQTEQKKEERILKTEESLRNILDNIKHNNIMSWEYQKEKSEQGIENLFEEILSENF